MIHSGQHSCSLNSQLGDKCDLPTVMLNVVCTSPGNTLFFPVFLSFFKMNEEFDMELRNRKNEVDG